MSEEILSFSEFMNQALYAPETGYYTRDRIAIGAQGDFITAPECSSLFSQAVSRQLAASLAECEQGVILELGAGSGRFAIDALKQLQADDALPEQYWILERSTALQAVQRENIDKEIPELSNRVKHLSSLPDKPFEGVIFGNEVLDALAVDCFVKRNGHILERAVKVKDAEYEWCEREASSALVNAVQHIESEVGALPESYASEVCLCLPAWLKSVCDNLTKGSVVFIDYMHERRDYYNPHRRLGTLMCYHQHKAHDNPLIHVGEQDITAHVDADLVAEAAEEAGLECAQFTTQCQFLAEHGIMQLAEKIDNTVDRHNQLMRIMHPDQMGEVFKALVFNK